MSDDDEGLLKPGEKPYRGYEMGGQPTNAEQRNAAAHEAAIGFSPLADQLTVQQRDLLAQRVEELEQINEGHAEDKAVYRERIIELQAELYDHYVKRRSEQDWQDLVGKLEAVVKDRDQWRMLAETGPITNEPLLGLATTEDLFRELISRFKMNMYGAHTKLLDFERALVLAEMLGGMDANEREYRTVDG